MIVKKTMWAFAAVLLYAAMAVAGQPLLLGSAAAVILAVAVLFLYPQQAVAVLKSKRAVWVALLACIGTLCANLGQKHPLGAAVHYLAGLAGFFVGLVALLAWIDTLPGGSLAESEADTAEKGSRLQVFWCVFGLQAAGLAALWLSSFYPSGISADTENQWQQIHGEIRYSDVHTLGHTIFLKLLLHICDSYAIVILVQILAVAALVALFAAYLYGRGVPYGYILLFQLVFLCMNLNEVYMYPWKDTPYTVVLGLVCYFIMRSLDKDYDFTLWRSLGLALALVWMFLFRTNGIVPLIGCAAYFVVYFIRRKKLLQLVSLALVPVVCVLSVNWYGYQVLKADSPPNGFSVQIFGAGVSAVVAKDGNMTDAQRERIEEILPTNWIRAQYDSWNPKNLIWGYEAAGDAFFADPNNKVFNNHYVVALGQHRDEVVSLYFQLLPKNFSIMVTELLFTSHGFWSMADLESNGMLLLLLFVAVVASRRKGMLKSGWPVLLPMVLNAVSIVISTITSEERYYLPTFTLFAPLLLYWLFAGPDRAPAPRPKGEQPLQQSAV